MINKLFFSIVTLLLLVTTPLLADQRWEGTWATAPEFTGPGDMPKTSLSNRAARQIIHVSMGGTTLRMQLSNHFGNGPVDITAVYVADPADTPQGKILKQETNILPCNARINAKTVRYLTFNHRRSLTLDAGKDIYSDPFGYQLRPGQRLAVTVVYGKRTPEHATSHRGSRTTTYILAGKGAPKADFSQGEKLTTGTTSPDWKCSATPHTRSSPCSETPSPTDAARRQTCKTAGQTSSPTRSTASQPAAKASNATKAGGCKVLRRQELRQETRGRDELRRQELRQKQESAKCCKSTADCCQKGFGVLNLGIGGNCVVRGD